MFSKNIKIKQCLIINVSNKIIYRHLNLTSIILKKTDNNNNESNNNLKTSNIPNSYFIKKLLGLSSGKSAELLENHKELCNLSRKDITNTANALKSLNYTTKDIIQKPMVLYVNYLTVLNRYNVLKECGCKVIDVPTLAKYVAIMNKEIALLKNHKLLSLNANIEKKLIDCFTDIKVQFKDEINDKMSLKQARRIVLNSYLKAKLEMTETDLDKLWKTYSRLKHKSYASIQLMIHILIDDLNFSLDRIIKNGYLLYGDPVNVRKMLLEIKSIGNESFKEIVYRRPKILMSTTESIQQTLKYIDQYNIPELALIKCIEVLTLGPDTIRERLEELNSIEEFKVLSSNPRILRLVHYQNKARQRLEYLNQIKVKCASLHILSCGSDAFLKFARDGSDRNKGKDLIIYLADVFKKSENEVRKIITRHPNWCHIPVLQIKQCIEELLKKNFTLDDIFTNIHIILYPMKRIIEKIVLLRSSNILDDFKLNLKDVKLTNKQILTLSLYLIESEFHFTGDGIWTEQHTQTVENFNNLLPDFPEGFTKTYKYGVRPKSNAILPV